jgi:hypothetical protein
MSDTTTLASGQTVPLNPEIFDDESTNQESGRLADLLRLWNELVRAELGSVQSFTFYDRQAQKQQRWHQWMVIAAAITGALAVFFAILKLAPATLLVPIRPALEWGEPLFAVLAFCAVVIGVSAAFHTRWHLLRMKAEQYRFLKFHILLHAAAWLKRPEHERRDELRTLLAGIHALDKHHAHEWSQGTFSLVDDDPALVALADRPLAEDIIRYFRSRRLSGQRKYFAGQARKRRDADQKTWFIPPTCFLLSIVCALVAFGGHVAEDAIHLQQQDGSQHAKGESGSTGRSAAVTPHDPHATDKPPTPFERFLMTCMIGAAAFPVFGAMIRTIRTAFEFGRNANRFEGVARLLDNVEYQLKDDDIMSPDGKRTPADQRMSPAVKLELLREAEFVLQHENRSWMRLMIEAEWFG